jgi:amino-acid N-acetyltransferase
MEAASGGLLLPRPFGDLYRHLREFYVLDDDEGLLCGCCALAIAWDDIAEVRSLVVRQDMRSRRLGQKLVEACMSEAVTLGIPKVFTLTYQTDFFTGLGYRVVEKDVLPNKIWADCIHCPKFPDCDETAMLVEL